MKHDLFAAGEIVDRPSEFPGSPRSPHYLQATKVDMSHLHPEAGAEISSAGLTGCEVYHEWMDGWLNNQQCLITVRW